MTDRSNNGIAEIIKVFNYQVQVFYNAAERMGKVATIKRAMQFVTTPFVFFLMAIPT